MIKANNTEVVKKWTNYLLNVCFCEEDIDTQEFRFYLNDLCNTSADGIADVDKHAWMNSLFGYDIGYDNAIAIDNWLWNNNRYPETVMEVSFANKDLIENVVRYLNLGLNFDKWATEDPKHYTYY